MGDWFRLLMQFLHVFAAVLWIGGGFYTLIVQVPALMAAPPAARGPVLGQIAPRQINYILRVAEITLVTGILNLFATGRIQQFLSPFSQSWTVILGAGILLAFGLYGLVRATVVPATYRLLSLGPKAAGGDAAAAAEMAAIIERLKRMGRIQLVLGSLIILAMITARLS
ncbi:MAG: hypothetical protein AUH85_11900 [Chloroflexi bacterium 13_1_40CM_4_68_4]|nr:MAG: hypothetical protein AUH85_11900 [Chloroflexi bacterium 13_1_40CM_4_68_4]